RARDPAHYRARYAARIGYVDSRIGRVLEDIDRLGLEQDTVVAFTSDHGELLGEHEYYFQHGITVLQPVVHVPLILSGPGIRGGATVSRLASNTDVMPTLLDLLEIAWDDLARQMDGHSLMPALQGAPAGKGEDHPAYAMCERTREWSVMEGKYKFTISEPALRKAGRLVDIEEDPAEEQDIAAREPRTAERLRAGLLRFRSTAPALLSEGQPERPEMTEED
ncbi:MAG: sulfatase-like hydrolase/transferase, partial [Gemmatimonadales bacterium]|nr:sulfatase-like hydrolase/transferase [Gemmatimonadales bacterium]